MEATLTPAQIAEVIKLYIAYFNRAPEYQGLQFHVDAVIEAMESGASFEGALNARADNFYEAAVGMSEQTGYSADMTPAAFVAVMYENVLLRPGFGGPAPTDDEINYWVEKLLNNELSRGEIATSFLEAVDILQEQGTAAEKPLAQQVGQVLENRVEVGIEFAKEENSGSLTGEAAYRAGKNALVGVDETPESVQQAIDRVEQGGGSGNPNPPDPHTFALTQQNDEFSGTAANNTFNSQPGTLQDQDALIGGGGYNTLNARITNGQMAAPELDDVDRINLTVGANGGGISLANSTSSGSELTVTGSGRSEFAGLTMANTAFSFTNYNGPAVLGYRLGELYSDDDAISVALNNTQMRLGVTDLGDERAVLETLNLNSVGSTSNEIALVFAGSADIGDSGRTGVGSIANPEEGGVNINDIKLYGSQSLGLTITEGAYYYGIGVDGSALSATSTVRADVGGNEDWRLLTSQDMSYDLASLTEIDQFEIVASDGSPVLARRLLDQFDPQTQLVVRTSFGSFDGDAVAGLTVRARETDAGADTVSVVMRPESGEGPLFLRFLNIEGAEDLRLVSEGGAKDFQFLQVNSAFIFGDELTSIRYAGDAALGITVEARSGQNITVDASEGEAEFSVRTTSAANDGEPYGVYTIIGSDQQDHIVLQSLGADVVTGGGGADVFNLTNTSNMSAVDWITDFNVAEGDRFNLLGRNGPGLVINELVQAGELQGNTLRTAMDAGFSEYDSAGAMFFTWSGRSYFAVENEDDDIVVDVTNIAGAPGFGIVGASLNVTDYLLQFS